MKKPYTKPTLSKIKDRPEKSQTEIGPYTISALGKSPRKTLKTAEETLPMLHQDNLDPLVSIAADVVSAYISNNPLPAADLPNFIGQIYTSLKVISGGTPTVQPGELKAAVPVRKSVTPDFIVCLEDGKRFKSLKRHIGVHYGLTPDQYRTKWNLPSDYPMVAANYSARRSTLAKSMGLGRKPK